MRLSDILPLIAAPLVGSFLGVIIVRADDPVSMLTGRSACPHCRQRLAAWDLVPILSWFALRGRCRHCGAAIGWFYPAVELATLAVALWAFLVDTGMPVWVGSLFGWCLLALAIIDLRQFLLPDFLSLPLIAGGLIAGWVFDPPSLMARLIGVAAGGLFVLLVRAVYYLLRRREGIGLGDAKLLAAAGAWVTWQGLPSTVLIAALSALAYALLLHRRERKLSATEAVPFGAFLCLGLWLVYLYGPLV